MNESIQSKLTLPPRLSAMPAGVLLLDHQDRATIYNGVEAVRHIRIVEQGYVKLHRVSAQGRQSTLSLLGRGAVFGSIDHPLKYRKV